MKPLFEFKERMYSGVYDIDPKVVAEINTFTWFIEDYVQFFERPGFFGYKSHYLTCLTQLEEAIERIDEGLDE